LANLHEAELVIFEQLL